MSTATVSSPSCESTIRPGATVPLDVIGAPGAYVCNWSGHLLRVSSQALLCGHRPLLNLVGSEPLTVTKISDDPDIPLATAKLLAQRLNLRANF